MFIVYLCFFSTVVIAPCSRSKVPLKDIDFTVLPIQLYSSSSIIFQSAKNIHRIPFYREVSRSLSIDLSLTRLITMKNRRKKNRRPIKKKKTSIWFHYDSKGLKRYYEKSRSQIRHYVWHRRLTFLGYTTY